MGSSRNLLMSVAAVGFVAPPALSADVTAPDNGLLFSGLFGASAGIHDGTIDEFEPNLDEGTEFTIAGHGHVSMPLDESFSIQLDGQGEFYDRSTADTWR